MSQPIEILPSAPVPSEGGCGCGEHDSEIPVLDVRVIPHAIRHATVFGAFSAIAPGDSLVIVAPHAPRPLLAQLAEKAPIDVEYLVEGPEAWHVKITRQAVRSSGS